MPHQAKQCIMLTKISKLFSTNKYLWYLFVFISFISITNSSAQSFSFNKNSKVIHSLGFSMNNNYYLPEKIYDELGGLKRKPSIRYGYEFNVNYNIILPKNFGIKANIYLFGTIPDGYNFNYKDALSNDYVWANGFIGNPLFAHKSNFSAATTGIPYFGFDLLLNYSYQIHKNIIIQPELGLRFMSIFRYSTDTYSYVCDSNQSNCILYHQEYANNYENKRQFFPDLVTTVNFLIFNKHPKHNLKLGLSFNYGFVPRLEGNYELKNMGSLNSTGKMKYGSTYFGFNVGYQFLGLHKKDENNKSNVIFNPRY